MDSTIIKERLFKEFTTHIEAIFYFCLKKTGDRFEAEELSSDIALNVLNAIKKGTEPENFPAWMWKIARNRYSVWVDKKNRNPDVCDIDEIELQSNIRVSDEIIHSEELALLRRELAFISSEYRNIVVAFYIDDRKVSDIAKSLNLPEGTVKSKLFRARNLLKEGMNMSREFGVRSYKPENISFCASGNQPSGYPWKAVERTIPKNILLEASSNPSPAEELAIALGIALPYMEEEIELLVKSTLLRRVGSKYVTDFYIVNKECHLEIYNVLNKECEKRSEIIHQIVSDTLSQIRELGVVRNVTTDDELKWWLVLHLIDVAIMSLDSYTMEYPTKRENDETWGFVGYEDVELPRNISSGHNGYGDKNGCSSFYKIGGDYGMWERVGEMNVEQSGFLADVIRSNRNKSTFTEFELHIWQSIDGRFAHSDKNGKIIPDIIVLDNITYMKVNEIHKSHKLYGDLKNNVKMVFEDIINVLKKYSTPILKEQLFYCASIEIFGLRMVTVHDLVDTGRLIIPEEPDKSTVAMALNINMPCV